MLYINVFLVKIKRVTTVCQHLLCVWTRRRTPSAHGSSETPCKCPAPRGLWKALYAQQGKAAVALHYGICSLLSALQNAGPLITIIIEKCEMISRARCYCSASLMSQHLWTCCPGGPGVHQDNTQIRAGQEAAAQAVGTSHTNIPVWCCHPPRSLFTFSVSGTDFKFWINALKRYIIKSEKE